jgi:hypothetical protein
MKTSHFLSLRSMHNLEKESESESDKFHVWRLSTIFVTRKLCTMKKKIYACNRPWRPIGLWDVEAPTFSTQSAHRWRWGCQPSAPAGRPLPPERFLVLISVKRLSRPQGYSAAGRIRSAEKSSGLIGNWTRDLPAYSIVPQPTTLPRAPM